MLESLVHQLSQELHMEEWLATPEAGHYSLTFDGDLQVDLIQTSHSYLFKGLIGACPPPHLNDFISKAMEANLFGRGTRGAAIGLNDEENLLTLSFELDYNTSYKDFREKLEDFVSILDFWRQQIVKHH